MAKKKKYTLSQRLDYYYNISHSEYLKGEKSGKFSNKYRFASGYLQGAERGRSLNFDKLNKYEKLGQIAGEKARKKSENIKF